MGSDDAKNNLEGHYTERNRFWYYHNMLFSVCDTEKAQYRAQEGQYRPSNSHYEQLNDDSKNPIYDTETKYYRHKESKNSHVADRLNKFICLKEDVGLNNESS